jgi:hypothetical protein
VGLWAGFVILAVAIAIGFVAAVVAATWRMTGDRAAARRAGLVAAIGALVWLGVSGGAARVGALRFDPPPPTMIVLLVAVLGLAIGLSRAEVGRRLAFGLPLSVLIGFQGFRVVVEVLMHRAYVEGLMPVQMSYQGRNFDIVSGATAAVLGLVLLVRGAPRWVLLGWNLLGLGLLLNVLVIALLSAPGPFRRFLNEPSNVWVTAFPWVWLPAVMVLAALLGHLLLFRRLAGPRPDHR